MLRDGRLIDTKPVSEIDQIELVHRMVGRELKDIYPPKAAPRRRRGPARCCWR